MTVIDVPGRTHLAQVNALRRQLHVYDAMHPEKIHTIASGGECKILVADLESERHRDLAIYQTRPPRDAELWAAWIPEIVVEVVSPGAEHRDYVEKREEYLRCGVTEYWILDAQRRELPVLVQNQDRWTERVVRPPDSYSTPLLPGFAIHCGAIFAAADAAGE